MSVKTLIMTEGTESGDLSNMTNRENVSNMFILEPDIGLGDHISRINRNNENSRREESSISFRRFLQNDGPNRRPIHPDLYSCARQDRSHEGAAINPESPDLPDFVQDHIAVEQMYFNDGTPSSSANLPDFASFVTGRESEPNSRIHDAERRRNRNRVPLDLPMPSFASNNSSNDRSRAGLTLPFDLTTDSSESNIASNGSRLPDFLSDGHIFGSDNPTQNNLPSTSHNFMSDPRDLEEQISVSMLERDNERLREELQVLRSALMKKDDRIKELENIVMALEISKEQIQTDANTQTIAKGNDNEAAISSQQESERPKEKGTFNETCRADIFSKDSKLINPSLALKVKEMTNNSERLVRELLRIITDFQIDIDQEDASPSGLQNTQSVINLERSTDICSPSSSKDSFHLK